MFLRILLLPSAFPSVFAFSIHISNSSAAYLIPKPTALLQGIPCCDICVWNIQINFLWCRCYLENGSLCKGEVHLAQLHFRKIIRVGGKITLRPKPSRVFSEKKETYESFAGFYLVSFMAGRELALSWFSAMKLLSCLTGRLGTTAPGAVIIFSWAWRDSKGLPHRELPP